MLPPLLGRVVVLDVVTSGFCGTLECEYFNWRFQESLIENDILTWHNLTQTIGIVCLPNSLHFKSLLNVAIIGCTLHSTLLSWKFMFYVDFTKSLGYPLSALVPLNVKLVHRIQDYSSDLINYDYYYTLGCLLWVMPIAYWLLSNAHLMTILKKDFKF